MFERARRFRVLAALGLVLALAQAGAWGGETIWTKAAGLLSSILKPRCALPPLPAKNLMWGIWDGSDVEIEPPPPIFAWEKTDDAEWHLILARMYEATRPAEAYTKYKWLSRRHPQDRIYADAAERLKGHLMEEYYRVRIDWNYNECPLPGIPYCIELEEMIDRLEASDKDYTGNRECFARLAALPSTLPAGDAPVTDDPMGVSANPPELHTCTIIFGPCINSEAALGRLEIVLKKRSFLLSRPTELVSTAPVLPERKDMLPDSECSRLLSEMGVIADARQLLPDSFPRGFIDSD